MYLDMVDGHVEGEFEGTCGTGGPGEQQAALQSC
jgi:hypothetical protein